MSDYTEQERDWLNELQVMEYCLHNHPPRLWEIETLIKDIATTMDKIPVASPVYSMYLEAFEIATMARNEIMGLNSPVRICL